MVQKAIPVSVSPYSYTTEGTLPLTSSIGLGDLLRWWGSTVLSFAGWLESRNLSYLTVIRSGAGSLLPRQPLATDRPPVVQDRGNVPLPRHFRRPCLTQHNTEQHMTRPPTPPTFGSISSVSLSLHFIPFVTASRSSVYGVNLSSRWLSSRPLLSSRLRLFASSNQHAATPRTNCPRGIVAIMDCLRVYQLFLRGYDARPVGSDGRPARRLPAMVRCYLSLQSGM
jgi:hypothetical protein